MSHKGEHMEIVFSVNNNEKVMVLPVAPEWEISEDQANETFQGLTTNIRMIGNRELATISISSFFPSKRYPYLSPYADVNPWAYVAFFKNIKTQRIPARLVITGNQNEELLNMAVSIDKFTYKLRKNGDVDFTLDMTEYVFIRAGGYNG